MAFPASGWCQGQASGQGPDAQPQTSETVDADANLGTGEILVTARRRAERLQDVPVAVTAVTGASLAQANIVQVQDIQQKAPGMSAQSSSFGSNVLQISIRGQRQFDPYITKDPAVAVYFADVVQNRPQGLNAALFDLESVQVLKGPQGTLFGRNTTGGAMIITPTAPGRDFGGYAKFSLGNYHARRLEGALNVPLSDAVQLRFAGALSRRDGFTRNLTTGQDLDDDNKNSWRISLRIAPTDGLENRLVVNGFDATENGVGYKLTGIRANTLATRAFPGLSDELAELAALPFYTTLSDKLVDTRIKTFAISNITEIGIGGATLKNIAGYRFVSSHIVFDLDGSRYNIFPSLENMKERQYSNELQLSGKAFGGSLDYILGGFYFLERGMDLQDSRGIATANPTTYAIRRTIGDPIRNKAYSFFGQVTYHLPFLDGVSITGGLRQNYDTRSLTSRNDGNAVTAANPAGCRLTNAAGAFLNPCELYVTQDYKKLTYTVSADWKISRDVLVYIAHRQGYRTGGFNISATTPAQFTPFRPEQVKDIEVGVKTEWRLAGTRGRFNLAAYSQDYKDIQRNQAAVIGGTFIQTIVNAASARIRGFEAELNWFPVEQLELGASVSHIDAKYQDWRDPRTNIDLSSSDFAGTPEWTVAGSAALTLPLSGDAGSILVRGDVYYQSRTNASDNNFDQALLIVSPTSYLKPYTVVNGRIDWRDVLGTKATIGLFGKNLLQAEYYTGGTDLATTIGATGLLLGAPRTYGIEVGFRF